MPPRRLHDRSVRSRAKRREVTTASSHRMAACADRAQFVKSRILAETRDEAWKPRRVRAGSIDRVADAYVQATRLKAFAPSSLLVSNTRFRSDGVLYGARRRLPYRNGSSAPGSSVAVVIRLSRRERRAMASAPGSGAGGSAQLAPCAPGMAPRPAVSPSEKPSLPPLRVSRASLRGVLLADWNAGTAPRSRWRSGYSNTECAK